MELNESYLKCETLCLNVMGGLCSRLRAVLAAADWCERYGAELHISWPRVEPNLSEFGGFSLHLQDLWHTPDNWFSGDMGVKQWPKRLDDRQEHERVLYIRTCHPEPFAPESPAALMRQFAKMVPKFEFGEYPDCIGVNIRHALRENHEVAKPEWFAGHCNQRFGVEQNYRFVADTQECFDAFVCGVKKYDSSVSWNARELDYDANGILTQAQELYELASTKWFVGSDASSYSQMIRWMRGDTELDIRKCDNRASRSEDKLNLADDVLLKEVFGG